MKAASIFISFFILVVSSSLIDAATIDLPVTGQTVCYDESGNEAACEGTGQDGEYRKGFPWNSGRFLISPGEDFAVDSLTGLVWTRDGNLPGAPMTWEEALAWVKGRNLYGWEDWRLPNVNELESLIHSGEVATSTWLENLALGFTSIQNDYCSSTTSLYNPGRVWSVGTASGNLFTLPKEHSLCNVWPVRYVTSPPAELWKTGQTLCYNVEGNITSCEGTGQDGDLQAGVSWPTSRFTDHGNGTVTDELTGLIWAKDANAPGPSACYPGTYKSWYGTYTYIQCLNDRSYLGFSDWRLPNRKELRSLIDYSQQDPALPPGHPFTNVQVDYDYRSSTGVAYLTGSAYAWVVSIADGGITTGWNGHAYYVWPVRGGKEFHRLTIAKDGSGGGTVTSVPAGINCGSDCTEVYENETVVTLTANPDPGTVFAGWSVDGGCPVAGDYQLTLTKDATITAIFIDTGNFTKVTMVFPNGGETFHPDQECTAIFGGPSTVESYKLFWSFDNGTTWKPVTTQPITENSVSWTIPKVKKNTAACRTKVIGYRGTIKVGTDKSDRPFTIEVLKLEYPNGGEPPFSSGQEVTITWSTHAPIRPVNKVKLSYSLDSGLTWKPFLSQPPVGSDPGSHTVQLPMVTRTKSNCKVKVVLKDSNNITVGSDVSNEVFTILKP